MSNTATAVPPVGSLEVSRLEPLRPLPVREVQRAMREYQDGLAAILADSDYQSFKDRDGEPRKFVKRSGWRKIATWFGLDLHIGRITVERDEHGRVLLAEVVGRAVAPNGRVSEDVGACSADERRFSKPEHDIRAVAATRALNRAISNLTGMGDVSAEEMVEDVEPLLPDWAQACSDEDGVAMLDQLANLIGPELAQRYVQEAATKYGYVPNVLMGGVRVLHRLIAQRAAEARRAEEQPKE